MAGNAGAQALSRNLDKVFEETQLTGQLCLHGRNLRQFPTTAAKFELSDTVVSDLARNRLQGLPVEVCEYGSLDILYLHHNAIRYIPEHVQFMETLTYLDLGRNQLTTLPSALFKLPLEVLLVGHNRLESISQDISCVGGTLMELDLSCNRLSSLPSGLGDLRMLRVLNLRENLLSELPYESVCRLRLNYMDVSANRLTALPSDLRHMSSLINLIVANNPLESPPAKVCTRGRVHIFKWLEVEFLRRNKRRGLPDLDWPPCRAASLTRSSRIAHSQAEEHKASGVVPKRRERGSRYNTVGAESGYGSMAEESHRLSRDLSQQNGCNDRSASVVGMRRSPPVGEEAPPPPPESKRRYTPFQQQKPNIPLSNGESPRKETPKGSFFDEVMNALNSVGTVAKQRSSLTEEDSPTPKATPNNKPVDSFPYPLQVSTNGTHNTAQPTTTHNNGVVVSPRTAPSAKIAEIYTTKSPTLRKQEEPKRSVPEPVRSEAELKMPEEKKDSADSGFSETQSSTIKKQPPETRSARSGSEKVKRSLAPSLSSTKSSSNSLDTQRPLQEKRAPVKPDPSSLSSSESSLSSSSSRKTPVRRPGRAPPEPPKPITNRRVPRDSLATSHASSLRKSADPHVQHAQIDSMKKIMESRLEITLPDDRIELAAALSDGVLLCTFANQLRARAIPSVHATSASVPTLSPAKCRRNVENFLMACRRLGVPESQICTQADILDKKSLAATAKTVAALMKQTGAKSSKSPPTRSRSDQQLKQHQNNLNNNNTTSSSTQRKKSSTPPRTTPTSPKVSNV